MDCEFKIVYKRNGRPCGQSDRHFDSMDEAIRSVNCRPGETAEIVRRPTGEWTSANDPQPREWLETMLAHAVSLISQMRDQVKHDGISATTGPSDDPDKYDPGRFMAAVRAKYPSF